MEPNWFAYFVTFDQCLFSLGMPRNLFVAWKAPKANLQTLKITRRDSFTRNSIKTNYSNHIKRYVQAIEEGNCNHVLTKAEDVEIGRCLGLIGVKVMDTRDGQSKDTFFPFSPGMHLLPGGIPESSWFWNFIYYPNPTVRSKIYRRVLSFLFACALNKAYASNLLVSLIHW